MELLLRFVAFTCFSFVYMFGTSESKKHTYSFVDDRHLKFHLTTFGFLKHSTLTVDITRFSSKSSHEHPPKFLLSLERIKKSNGNQNTLPCHPDYAGLNNTDVVLMNDDPNTLQITIVRFGLLQTLKVCDRYALSTSRQRRSADEEDLENSTSTVTGSPLMLSPEDTNEAHCSLPSNISLVKQADGYTFAFIVYFDTSDVEGKYELYLHVCDHNPVTNFTFSLVEDNNGNYLSAGQMPLSKLHIYFGLAYFALAIVWIWVLAKSSESRYKTHYLMLLVVLLKCLTEWLHAVNFYIVSKNGHHDEYFTILYYITYLMKGTLMLFTVLLIAAGWTFVKYAFSDREKKVFIIIIPLQILANIAHIILDETEEASPEYETWQDAFILLDLLCFGAILFPVVWSIRHLQEAANTDGKAAINLKRLQIFRHFYIMVVCYIYFSRIIVYLLKMTLPFRYEWLFAFFQEIVTLLFIFFTGYKFRPTSESMYLQLAQSDDEEDTVMDEVVTGQAVFDNLKKVNTNSETALKESSHVYD